MHEVRDALAILDSSVQPLKEIGIVETTDCLKRILAEPVIASEDYPAFDNSAMDGYVFLKRDLKKR